MPGFEGKRGPRGEAVSTSCFLLGIHRQLEWSLPEVVKRRGQKRQPWGEQMFLGR